MDLTVDKIERYLNCIFTGKEVIQIGDICILLKQPDNNMKLLANNAYDKTYKEALDEGILPIKELEKLIIERKLFTAKDEEQVNSLRSKLEAQLILLSKTTKVKANADRIKGIIKDLREQISDIERKKYSKLAMSAETKAEEERASYLCWLCAYKLGVDELYWVSYEDFLNEIDLVFRSKTLTKFLKFYGGIDTKIIRYIARSSLWRIRYVTSQKVSESLFGVPTSQYTNDMLNLAYWSNFYQNIYEMLPESRPSDLIIDDDEALDAFMKSHYEERNREDAAKRSKNRTQGKLSAFDSEEVIVTQSNELYEDIEYNEPREARLLKDKIDIKKRTRRR